MQQSHKELKKRIMTISYKHGLSHLGSNISAVDTIDEIYRDKKPNEPFILSSGHAGVALYVVIEKYEGIDAEKIYRHHGVHPDRCRDCHLFCSTGSLGHGLPVALGMALADMSRKVYVLLSDGECAEGSVWEALNFVDRYDIKNLIIYVNINGYGGYGRIDQDKLEAQLFTHYLRVRVRKGGNSSLPFLHGQDAHYYVMKPHDYMAAMNLLK